MPEHMGVNAMPVLARLIMAFDLLQIGPGGYVIEDILNLTGSDVAIPVAWE